MKHSTLGELHIYYDGTRPDMVLYNGATYRYVHSLQGDILGLQDSAGNLVVEYRYDAWGRQISKTGSLAATLGTLNPFRYRGYVFDEENGLYYLRSRYYNPEWGRFINADVLLGKRGVLLSHNLFTYCRNNSVKYSDHNGYVGVFAWISDKWKQYSRLSPAEQAVAIWHPFAAREVARARDEASAMTDRIFGEGVSSAHDGTIANAFKHAYWNALMTRRIGEPLAKEFADAHEEQYLNDSEIHQGFMNSEHSQMDLFFNEVGRECAIEFSETTDIKLAEWVLFRVYAINSMSDHVLNQETQYTISSLWMFE